MNGFSALSIYQDLYYLIGGIDSRLATITFILLD